MSLNDLSTVAVVTGMTSAIDANFIRFGKPDYRVLLVKILCRLVCVDFSLKFANMILLNISTLLLCPLVLHQGKNDQLHHLT